MAYQRFSVTMTSGASLTGALDLGNQPAWRKVYLDPTGAGAEVRLYTSDTQAGTYRYVAYQNVASSSAGIMKVGSALSGCFVELPAAGLRFIKVETTGAIAGGNTFTLICAD
jgi:hypothetical protein